MEAFTNARTPYLSFYETNIPAITNIFRGWRSSLPNIETFVGGIIANINFSNKSKNIISAAAKMAAEQNDNPFHGNRHFLQVFSLTYVLGKQALEDGRINKNTFRNMLAAALIHDYKHDGRNNDGIQFRLEEIAVSNSAQALTNAGATLTDLKHIKAFVYATDISKKFSDPTAQSPADSLKAHLTGSDKNLASQDLQKLIDDSSKGNNLVDASIMLQEADVGCAILDAETCHYNGQCLSKEQNKGYDPSSQVFFMERVICKRFFSPSAINILEPFLVQTMRDFGISRDPPKVLKPTS